jgi:hypothetical protein
MRQVQIKASAVFRRMPIDRLEAGEIHARVFNAQDGDGVVDAGGSVRNQRQHHLLSHGHPPVGLHLSAAGQCAFAIFTMQMEKQRDSIRHEKEDFMRGIARLRLDLSAFQKECGSGDLNLKRACCNPQ